LVAWRRRLKIDFLALHHDHTKRQREKNAKKLATKSERQDDEGRDLSSFSALNRFLFQLLPIADPQIVANL